jgi:penicillin-binding protein 1A
MWGAIMKQIHDGLAYKDFEKPSGIVTASVCKDSGKIPTDLCANDPRGSQVISDMFIQGTVPTESCDIHVKALVDTATGKLANEYTPPGLAVEKIFIKRQYPVGDNVADYQYQIPMESDPIPGEAQYPSNGNQGQQPGEGEPATP